MDMVALSKRPGHLLAGRPDDWMQDRFVLEQLLVAGEQLSIQLDDGAIIGLLDSKSISPDKARSPREEQNRRKKRSPSHNNPFLFSRGECGVATAIKFSLNLAASNQEAAQ